MSERLQIIEYPDPRLKRASTPVERFDDELRKLAARMLELMREAHGVGLAAPQVGMNIQMFVMNHTQQPGDDTIVVNPILIDASAEEEADEGCLSLPHITTNVVRPATITLRAQDELGKSFERTATGYIARIWQHETDHLNGILIIDRAGPSAKMLFRPALRELEEKYAAAVAARGKARPRRVRR